MKPNQLKLNTSEDYIKSLKKAEQLFEKKNLLKSNLQTLYSQTVNSKKNLSVFTFNSESESKFQSIDSNRSDHSNQLYHQRNANQNFQYDESDKKIEIQNNITDYFQIVDKLQSDILEITKLFQEFKSFKQQINKKIISINTQTQERIQDNHIKPSHNQEMVTLQNIQLKSKLKKAEEYIKILKIRNDKLVKQLRQESKFKEKMDPINFVQEQIAIQDIFNQIMDQLRHNSMKQQRKIQSKCEKYIKNLKMILCNYFRAEWATVKKIIQYDKYSKEIKQIKKTKVSKVSKFLTQSKQNKQSQRRKSLQI